MGESDLRKLLAQLRREGGQVLGNVGDLGGELRHGGQFGAGDAVLFKKCVDVAKALRGMRNAHQAVLKGITADWSYRRDRWISRFTVRQCRRTYGMYEKMA